MSVNAREVKRKAHVLGRGQLSRDQTWNPFRHVSWGADGRRAQTWDASQAEQQPIGGDGSQRLSQVLSEPPQRKRDPNQDLSTADTMTGSRDEAEDPTKPKGSDTDAALQSEKPNGGPSTFDNEGGLRNRKQDDENAKQREEDEQNAMANANDDYDTNGKKKKEGFLRHVQPKAPYTFANQLQRTFLNSWINVLLVAVPVGIALNYVPSIGGVVVFVVNFIAIIPLAAMLSFATEEIALRTGETLGGLLNATFGNAVELIVAILALIDGQISIVQTSLIGSILSNLLLVVGCCFFFGGLRRPEQYFNVTVAQTAASLLALAAASVIVPTVFDVASKTSVSDVAKLSRGTSVILLLVYACYLFFQLKTHQDIYNAESQKVAAKPWNHGAISSGKIKQGLMPPAMLRHAIPTENTYEDLAQITQPKEDEDEDEGPQLHFYVALGTLLISTVFIALCAEFMVDGINAVTKSGGLSKEFVGLILLPIVGNAAEHATAVTVAIKDKMDLSLGVAIGSSMQVALLLIPFMVIVGWGMGNDEMNLSFDIFQVAVMFVAVLLTNYLISDGKSHWLEGVLLMCLYAIIAVCAFWYP